MAWREDWTVEMVEGNFKALGVIDPEDIRQLIEDAKELRRIRPLAEDRNMQYEGWLALRSGQARRRVDPRGAAVIWKTNMRREAVITAVAEGVAVGIVSLESDFSALEERVVRSMKFGLRYGGLDSTQVLSYTSPTAREKSSAQAFIDHLWRDSHALPIQRPLSR